MSKSDFTQFGIPNPPPNGTTNIEPAAVRWFTWMTDVMFIMLGKITVMGEHLDRMNEHGCSRLGDLAGLVEEQRQEHFGEMQEMKSRIRKVNTKVSFFDRVWNDSHAIIKIAIAGAAFLATICVTIKNWPW